MSGHHSAFYTQYIASDEWAERRAAYYKTHRKACKGCYSNRRVHLHHHTYERLGKELDEDLVPLCFDCHEKVHLYHDLHRHEQTLTISTLQWLVKRNPRLKQKPTPRPKIPPKPPRVVKGKTRKKALRAAKKLRYPKEMIEHLESGKRGGV